MMTDAVAEYIWLNENRERILDQKVAEVDAAWAKLSDTDKDAARTILADRHDTGPEVDNANGTTTFLKSKYERTLALIRQLQAAAQGRLP